MNRAKIFRSNEFDSRLDEEFPAGSKKLKLIDRSSQGGFTAYYETGKFYDITWDEGPIQRRDVYCWLFAGAKPAGAFTMAEYQVSPFVTDDEFIATMDSWSLTAVTIAEAMCAAWPDVTDSVTDFGGIVEFERAWVAPEFAKRSEWAEIASVVLSRVFRRRSILVMKAFPLEYEGRVGPEREEASARRQHAMVRLYRRLFAVTPFPGPWGQDGWLYAIPSRLKGVISPPLSTDDVSR